MPQVHYEYAKNGFHIYEKSRYYPFEDFIYDSNAWYLGTFRIPFDKIRDIIYYFGKELHQPLSEIDNMEMYLVFMLLDKFMDEQKKQEEARQAETEQYEEEHKNMMNEYSPDKMMQNMSKFNPYTNSLNGMPKFDIPKFD